MASGDRVVVLYGSQTGTALEAAEGIWRRLRRSGLSGPLCAMDDYPIGNLIRERFVVFACSTTGDGEEPDNMKRFWKFLLRKSLPGDSLGGLRYAVLGLGDSSYAKFNFPAKKLNKRLQQLGGEPMIDVGLCDYRHDLGHDSVAEPWTEKLWKELEKYFPEAKFVLDDALPSFLPRWRVSRQSFGEDANRKSLYAEKYSNSMDESFVLRMSGNTRTTSQSHFQDVRLLQFEAVDGVFDEYEVGDVLYVRPKNSESAVDRFFQIFKDHDLKLNPDDVISLSRYYEDLPVPKIFSEPVRLAQIVEEYWDFSAIPKKYAFSILGNVSENKLEKDKCIELCSPEGQEELFDYCNRPRRNILEVLEDFHHSTSKLTLECLFELFTCIKPRAFSIASSCKAMKNMKIDILVAVVKYYTKLKQVRLGLCSNWLKDLTVGEEILGWIKKGTFVFPKTKYPIVMVGPGTGLAPFRSLIMEKEFLGEACKDTLILLFGCRSEYGDFHCSEYLKHLQLNKKLTLICAFSRDQDSKVYVQHKIEENGALIWDLLKNKNAYIYIAGSSKDMPDGVKTSLKRVISEYGCLTKDEGDIVLKELESCGRLQLETW